MRGEAVLGLKAEGMRRDFVGRRLAALVAVAIAVEQIGGERDLFADGAAEQVAGANAEFFARDIYAGHLDRRVDLAAIVIEARGRIHDLPAQLLKLKRIVTLQIRQHAAHARLRGFAAAAKFAKAGKPAVVDDFDDGADEATPMRARRVT